MVHNSWSSAFECASAYFRLVDDGVIEDRPLTPAELSATSGFHRDLHAHWMTTMVTDCCGAPMLLLRDARLQDHSIGCAGMR
jgi:hypothetical protein